MGPAGAVSPAPLPGLAERGPTRPAGRHPRRWIDQRIRSGTIATALVRREAAHPFPDAEATVAALPISGPGRSNACVSTIRRETGASTCVIVGAITGEGRHEPIDPFEQEADLRAVIGIPAGQHRSDDLASVSVRGEVQHLPRPAPLAAVLLLQPSTRISTAADRCCRPAAALACDHSATAAPPASRLGGSGWSGPALQGQNPTAAEWNRSPFSLARRIRVS